MHVCVHACVCVREREKTVCFIQLGRGGGGGGLHNWVFIWHIITPALHFTNILEVKDQVQDSYVMMVHGTWLLFMCWWICTGTGLNFWVFLHALTMKAMSNRNHWEIEILWSDVPTSEIIKARETQYRVQFIFNWNCTAVSTSFPSNITSVSHTVYKISRYCKSKPCQWPSYIFVISKQSSVLYNDLNFL